MILAPNVFLPFPYSLLLNVERRSTLSANISAEKIMMTHIWLASVSKSNVLIPEWYTALGSPSMVTDTLSTPGNTNSSLPSHLVRMSKIIIWSVVGLIIPTWTQGCSGCCWVPLDLGLVYFACWKPPMMTHPQKDIAELTKTKKENYEVTWTNTKAVSRILKSHK